MYASMFDDLLDSLSAGEELPASPLPPLKPLPEGGAVPDYAAWCEGYFQGCLECPEFMRDKVRFCRKWNRAVSGADVVELIMDGENGAASPAMSEPVLPETGAGRSWWTHGREVNGLINTIDHKKRERR